MTTMKKSEACGLPKRARALVKRRKRSKEATYVLFRTAKYLAVVHETRRRSRMFQLFYYSLSYSLFLSLSVSLPFSYGSPRGDGAEIRSATLKSCITVTIAGVYHRDALVSANVVRICSANIQHSYLIPRRTILLCAFKRTIRACMTIPRKRLRRLKHVGED